MIAGINRTDYFQSLISFASKSAGLLQRIKDLHGDTSVRITMGDIISTQIKTEKGILISLIHDTTLPRPRSLDFEIQGTKAIWQGDNCRIYVENVSPDETWESDCTYIEHYESLYWQQWGEEALRIDTHHEGMDYIMVKVLAEDLLGNLVYPATLNDLAFWTSVSPWSKKSIAENQTISFSKSLEVLCTNSLT